MTPDPVFISELVFALSGLAILVHAVNHAINWVDAKEQGRDPEIPVTYDPLGPAPFVEAQDVAPTCHRCGQPMELSPWRTAWMCTCSSGGKAA